MSALLAGKRILIVEDEPLVGMMLEEILTEAGAEVVGPATRMEDAITLAGSVEIDAASLDINLGGRASFPVADVLRARGVPFLFATGYGETAKPAAYTDVLILRKPFQEHHVLQAFHALIVRAEAQ